MPQFTRFDLLNEFNKFQRAKRNTGFELQDLQQDFLTTIQEMAFKNREEGLKEGGGGGGGGGGGADPSGGFAAAEVNPNRPEQGLAMDNRGGLNALLGQALPGGTEQTSESPTDDPRTTQRTTTTTTPVGLGGRIGDVGRIFKPDFLTQDRTSTSTTTVPNEQFQRGLDEKSAVLAGAIADTQEGGDPRRLTGLIQQHIAGDPQLRPQERMEIVQRSQLMAEAEKSVRARTRRNNAREFAMTTFARDTTMSPEIFSAAFDYFEARTDEDIQGSASRIAKIMGSSPRANAEANLLQLQGIKAKNDAERSFLETDLAERQWRKTTADLETQGIAKKLGFTSTPLTPLQITKELGSFVNSQGEITVTAKTKPMLDNLNRQQYVNGLPMTTAKFGFNSKEFNEIDTQQAEKDLSILDGGTVDSSGNLTSDPKQVDLQATSDLRDTARARFSESSAFLLGDRQPGESFNEPLAIEVDPNHAEAAQWSLILQGHNYKKLLEQQKGISVPDWRDFERAQPGNYFDPRQVPDEPPTGAQARSLLGLPESGGQDVAGLSTQTRGQAARRRGASFSQFMSEFSRVGSRANMRFGGKQAGKRAMTPEEIRKIRESNEAARETIGGFLSGLFTGQQERR